MRNAIGLLLLLSAAASGEPVNFTTWYEDDPYEVLTVSSGSVIATEVTRGTRCYLSADYGAGYFTDFHVRFQWTGGTLAAAKSCLLPFALTNSVGDWQANYYVATFGVFWTLDGGTTYKLRLVHQVTQASAQTDELSTGVPYYIDVDRDHDGGANDAGLYTMYVCTGNYYGLSGASLVDTVTLDVPSGEQTAYRYAEVCLSRANSSGYPANGTISSLDFGPFGSAPDPADEATLVALPVIEPNEPEPEPEPEPAGGWRRTHSWERTPIWIKQQGLQGWRKR